MDVMILKKGYRSI